MVVNRKSKVGSKRGFASLSLPRWGKGDHVVVDEVAPLGFSDDTIPAVILEGVQRTTEGSKREMKAASLAFESDEADTITSHSLECNITMSTIPQSAALTAPLAQRSQRYAHTCFLLPRSGATLFRYGATAVKNIVALLGTRDCPRIARCFFLSAPSLHRHLGAGCHGASNVLLRKTFPHTTRSTPFYA